MNVERATNTICKACGYFLLFGGLRLTDTPIFAAWVSTYSIDLPLIANAAIAGAQATERFIARITLVWRAHTDPVVWWVVWIRLNDEGAAIATENVETASAHIGHAIRCTALSAFV